MDPIKPSPQLLAKLGSIIVHAYEYISEDGHEYDLMALRDGLEDEEVVQWLSEMDDLSLVPKTRK